MNDSAFRKQLDSDFKAHKTAHIEGYFVHRRRAIIIVIVVAVRIAIRTNAVGIVTVEGHRLKTERMIAVGHVRIVGGVVLRCIVGLLVCWGGWWRLLLLGHLDVVLREIEARISVHG